MMSAKATWVLLSICVGVWAARCKLDELKRGEALHHFAGPLNNSECDSTQQLTWLRQFYNSTYGVSWVRNSLWMQGNNYCTWFGIRCRLSNCVSDIDLPQNNLQGEFPTGDLSVFPSLQKIDVSGNSFLGGHVPDLKRSPLLKYVDFGGCDLTGTLPEGIGNLHAMKCLCLEGNQISGSLTELMGAPSLESLYLSANYFDGECPDLTSSTMLTTLDISHNVLRGHIRKAHLPLKLQNVLLSSNEFSGMIPDLSEFKQLATLDLGYNELSGSIPEWIYTHSTFLKLVLCHNGLNGTLGNVTLSSLSNLDVSYNSLSGTLPPLLLADAWNIKYVDLSHNNLTGSLPDFPTSITSLNLCCQRFTGALPSSVGRMQELNFLDLSSNTFNSTLDVFGELAQSSLISLNLHNAGFNGPIWKLKTLGKQQTRVLNLGKNSLTGHVEDFFCNIQWLIIFDLSSNQLEGTIPTCLNQLEYLASVKLEDNTAMRGPRDKEGHISMPRFLQSVPDNRVYNQQKQFSCPSWVLTSASQAEFTIDPSYYGFQSCTCNVHFVGTDTCMLCPPGSVCPGGDTFTIGEGIWLSPDPYSVFGGEGPSKPIVCRNDSLLSNPCGSTSVNVSQPRQQYGTVDFPCARGYEGRLCSQCNQGFFRRGPTCLECHPFLAWLIPVLYVIFFGGLLYLALGTSFEGAAPNSVVGIVILHIQSISQLKEVTSIAWSRSLLLFFDLLSPLNFQVIAEECVLENTENSRLEQMKMLTGMMTPLFFTGLTMVMFLFGLGWHKVAPALGSVADQLKKWAFRCLYILLFFLGLNYINVTAQALSVFSCEADPATGTEYLRMYPSLMCYTPLHRQLMAMSALSLIFFSLGIPLFFFAVVYYYRHQLHMPGIYTTLGFMYCYYSPKYFWWEVVVFARRAAFIASLYLPAYHTFLGPILVLVVIQLSIILQVNCRPYNTDTQNFTEIVSLYCLQATYIAGLVIQVSWVARSGGEALSSVVLILNSLCLVYFAYALVSEKPNVQLARGELVSWADDTKKSWTIKYQIWKRGDLRKQQQSRNGPPESLLAVNEETHGLLAPQYASLQDEAATSQAYDFAT